ncbi:MAG: hypothetical protein Q4B58_05340 [Bacteroidales bacterium]|nr:hypothetical protein [Bacteroidales bacterium]
MKFSNIALFSIAAILSACSGNSNQGANNSIGNENNVEETSDAGVQFAPKKRTSSYDAETRKELIAQKRNELNQEINIDSIIFAHSVDFSVLPPVASENVPQSVSEKLTTRMIQISSLNGIGGLCTNPVLAMVCRVDCLGSSVTGTAPQKMLVKYEVTFYCGNLLTNSIYASASQEISGVGSSFEDAANMAVNELKNTPEMQKMLATAGQRAIEWYSNTVNIKKLVDDAIAQKDYAFAMSLLSSVPEKAEATYKYAEKKNEEVCQLYFEDKAAELLGQMESAIAAGGDEYNPEVGSYLHLISPRSSSYPRAKQLYDKYTKRMETVRNEIRDKEHRLELERLNVEKVRAPYEAQEAIERIKAEKAKNANTGGFLGLGKLWDGIFGIANNLLSK